MPKRLPHLLAAAVITAACVAAVLPAAAFASDDASAPAQAPAVTYTGALEFEGLAADKVAKGCRGEGAFGVAKPGAKVTVSEQDAAGDFSVLATGKLRKGKFATSATGDEVCRMPFKAKADEAPADDSTVYLEFKGITFNIRFPAADVADGDMGTWICEFSDTTCALVVG